MDQRGLIHATEGAKELKRGFKLAVHRQPSASCSLSRVRLLLSTIDLQTSVLL